MKTKNINALFVTSTPFPNGMAATNRLRNYCLGLFDNNVKPSIIVYRSTEYINAPNSNPNNGEWQGIKFQYASTSIRSKSFIKRRWDDFKDLIKTLKHIYISENDIVIIYMRSIIVETLSIIAAKLSKKILIRELCEYPYYKDCLNSKINLKLFRYYDGIIAISQELVQIARQHAGDKVKIIKVPILIDARNHPKSKFHNDRPYIFHGGTITESKDAIISTMKAFALANRQLKNKIDFIIAGPPSNELIELRKIIENNDLESNVKYLGKISADDIRQYQNGASLCILNKNDTLQNRCGFSTKLGEILLSGTAVITTTVGEANYWLKDGKSAYITEPHNPELIAQMIIRAFSDDGNREKIAKNGKEVALRNFDIKIQGPLLSNFLFQFV